MPVAELPIYFYVFLLFFLGFFGYNIRRKTERMWSMAHKFTCNTETAVVATTKGKVRGYCYDGISIFKGIPYAKAKRFHAPRPVEAWEGVLDATSYGYVCPLLEMGKPACELLVPHRYWVMNEDCQNLNVWTPACDGEKRPVIVWLHGGGFEAGSAIEQIAYEGENMCRIGQVVVVSVNHRLNVLGYCDLSDFGEEYQNSGNAGTEDIIAALRWIQENIALFGGDAGNVTLIGQSGGGAKITTLMQTPAADGLYAKGINMSGVVEDLLPDCEGSGKELVQALLNELQLGGVKDLESVSFDRLADAYKKVRPILAKEGKYCGGAPQKNRYYNGNPLKYGFRKETAGIPLMVGSVFGEFASFVAPPYDKRGMTKPEAEKALEEALGKEAANQLLPLFETAYPERLPVDILTLDYIIRHPIQKFVRMRAKVNPKTYSYLFNHEMPIDGGRTPWHCADIPYVFHNTELVPITQEEGISEKLEKQIFDSVMAFARTGSPENESVPSWPACTPDEENTMVFDRQTRLRTNHDEKLMPLVGKYMQIYLEKAGIKSMENVQH